MSLCLKSSVLAAVAATLLAAAPAKADVLVDFTSTDGQINVTSDLTGTMNGADFWATGGTATINGVSYTLETNSANPTPPNQGVSTLGNYFYNDVVYDPNNP